MKKHFYTLFAAASMMLAVTSCSQEEDFAPQSSNEMTTFSVSLNGVTGSRATGDGTTATMLYYQAYRDDELVIDNNVDINTTTKIDMSLLKGETYDIIFWAQAPGATFYQIDDLRSITIDYKTAALKANQESYDAFYNALNDFTSDAKTHTIELRRPFAKLNLGTSDWKDVEIDAATNENEPNPVTHTSVTVKGLANTLNTLTGEATGDEDVAFALSEIPTDVFILNDVEYKRLSLNYLLVPNSKAPQGLGEYQAEGEDGKANVDLAFALNRGDKQLFTIEVPNAPVQRNWRTNVVGDLLTGSKFDVVIKPETDGDYNTLEILEEVLAKGGEVTLFSDATLPGNITIPEDVTVKINLNEKTLNVNSGDNIIKGNLVISNGNLNVAIPSEGGARETAFEAVNGGTVEINDVKMTVASFNAAVTVDYSDTNSNRQAEVSMNVNNTTMTVENGGYGIWVPFGAKYVEINVNNSSITGNNAVLLSQVEESVVVIDEKSTINKLHVDGGHATIKYAGEKPTVAGEQYVTFVQMGITNYEGIYMVDASKKEYNVTSAEGLMNLNQLLSTLDLGEGKGAIINLTTGIDLAGKNWQPLVGMWVTLNGEGHTIKNMTVGSGSRAGEIRKAGFYGYAGAVTINDLTIENADVTGSQAGIFAGSGEGLKINNCYLKGTNKVTWVATEETWNGIGAITGVLQESTINMTIVEGATVELVKGDDFTTDEGCKFVDNLTGYITENKGNIINNGLVGTIVTDGVWQIAEKGYALTNVTGMKWLAEEVNEGINTFKDNTISLEADIDLNNNEWTPIGNSTNKFQGTFDGKNHTIKNLSITGNKTNVGLFGMTTDGEIKNLTVENAKVSGRLNVGVVAGTPYTSKYTNIKVVGHVEVNGMAYVGGVGGKNAYANWTDVAVDVDASSYVKANSVENGTAYRTYVGGVVGFNGEGGHSFTNITSNINVSGSTCDVGGLFGIAHYGNQFNNCSSNGKVEITNAAEAADAEEIGGIAGVWHNGGSNVVFTNCFFTGTLIANITEGVELSDNKIVGKAYDNTGTGKLVVDGKTLGLVSAADALQEQLNAGGDVVFTDNIIIPATNKGSNGYGETGIKAMNGQTIDGNKFEFNVEGCGGTWDSAINATGGVIKNLTISSGFRGVFVTKSENAGTVYLENVIIDGPTYTISCDEGSSKGLEATSCVFNGWTSYAGTIGNVKFTNCNFGEGAGYSFCRPYAPTTFIGCNFEAGYQMDARAAVTFENCKIGGVALTADNLATLVTSNIANATVK